MTDSDETPYPELTADLNELEISKLQKEKQALADRLKEAKNESQEYYRKWSDLNWSNRRAWMITAAIVVPILLAGLGFFFYGYNNFGGGPEARHVAKVQKKAEQRTHTWEFNCERAGGRIVGQGRASFCIFPNGASLNEYGTNS